MTLVDRLLSAMMRGGSAYSHPLGCRCAFHRRMRRLAEKIAAMKIDNV